MPWKNGQGMTTEVAIHPQSAKFPQDPFLWRISYAEVKADGPFSNFNGYDRLLTVWRGEGISLNGKPYSAFETIRFSGEEKINCHLVKGEVDDIGIIFRRDLFQCEMTSITLDAQKVLPINCRFIFCVSGEIEIQNQILKEKSFVCTENNSISEIRSLKKSLLIIIKIEAN
jgi:environmental stress-induced protein Ves